jgi:hypothetical protein
MLMLASVKVVLFFYQSTCVPTLSRSYVDVISSGGYCPEDFATPPVGTGTWFAWLRIVSECQPHIRPCCPLCPHEAAPGLALSALANLIQGLKIALQCP